MNEIFDNANVAVFMLNITITCTFSITGTEIDQNDLFPLEPTPFLKKDSKVKYVQGLYFHIQFYYNFVAKC